jgi:NhaP-type Na+/H+ or K+/H+ antiporter
MPLLRFVRPSGAAASILRWEGILIDPVGATLSLLVTVLASTLGSSLAWRERLFLMWMAPRGIVRVGGIRVCAASD